ncbi:biotin--[acetyl-CoA-carboxylase] ligase [Methylobacterium sp. Leaf104]|uniref:biotin--[acetyl-CoA-carboxylase] ligase n=1 Tax=Methylobacterium TaxID=407 RepID=UPI0006FC93E4|nr:MULTISPECIES: biotin--[acetyl-CoA-carboxylase] ligase [Methylobacterium]KQP42357.1 biotin--[acetyl-CoA-carboxylase] ligase [Methylobacterium sp. Leaf104]MCI9879125.1 biotin--[acetyl-CoA-carboxylase] ligase [Methylobacterium goesingense]
MGGYALGTLARGEGHRLHVHDRLGSTNTEALERFRAGEAGPLWVVAHRQEAGRGRRGNAWVSEPGNLTASLLWPVEDVEPGLVPTLGFVAGIALASALAACGVAGCRLKWPNDVLASGAKLAGLLLEAENRPGGRRAVVMGFGVNVAAAPQGLPYRATCLRQMQYDTRAEDLFVSLTDGIVDAARLWECGRGFSRIRERWIADAAGIGASVSVRTGDTLVHGIFETIDEAGRLVVRSEDGTRRTVTAGEVHLGTAATAA